MLPTRAEADAAGAEHSRHCARCTDQELIALAGAMVYSAFKLPPDVVEDAIQVAITAGWENRAKWEPGRCKLRVFLWTRMRFAVIDWIRAETGRHGAKAAVLRPASLDEDLPHTGSGMFQPANRYTFIPDQHAAADLEQVETAATVRAMIEAAGLTTRERSAVEAYLADELLRVTGERWGVTEARVSQVRKHAFAKLAAVA